MALPIVGPARIFYSQRIDGRPFVNCLPYSLCPALRWMGYDVPPTYGMELRKASGVPIAEHRGTSYADMRRALNRILPAALSGNGGGLTFGPLSDAALINALPRAARPNRASVLSVVARMEKLPTYLRRHVGYDWQGLHALTIYQRKRAPDGSWLVYYSDPMGRTYRGYSGEWVPYVDLQLGLKRNGDGLIHAIRGARRTAV